MEYAAWINRTDRDFAAGFFADFLRELAAAHDEKALQVLMANVARDFGCQYYALISHEDHRIYRPGQVDVREYPAAIAERIIGQGTYRRDPVFRGCMFADSAFIWSKLNTLIAMDRRDRATLEFGLSHGLNEGITVPCNKLGYCLGSATFAGKISAEQAEKLIGLVQMIGVFAFKHARELAGEPIVKGTRPRLNPRPRDCVALVARGLSNKQIARALNLAPRTVDGYLRDGYRLFNAANRAELLAAAVLAGEIGTDELK